MKIIIYILYIHENASHNLIREILNCGFGYMVISFQSYKISIYIDIPHQFRPFTYLHYATQFPQLTECSHSNQKHGGHRHRDYKSGLKRTSLYYIEDL